MTSLLCLLMLFISGFACSPQIGLKPVSTLGAVHFLPDDVPGWKKIEPLWEASTSEELYRRINGGATIFVKYGFKSYAGQTYQHRDGIEVEVDLFHLEEKERARQLFNDPLMKPRGSRKLESLGDEARIDESALFYSIVEFIQGPFFIRVTVQDKSKASMQIAREFARHILQKINNI